MSWAAEALTDDAEPPETELVEEVLELPAAVDDGIDADGWVGDAEPDGVFEMVAGDPALVELQAASDMHRHAPSTRAVILDLDIRPPRARRQLRSILG